jgi:hypothetical protein
MMWYIIPVDQNFVYNHNYTSNNRILTRYTSSVYILTIQGEQGGGGVEGVEY